MIFRSPFHNPVIAVCPSRRIDSCGLWATMVGHGGGKLKELGHPLRPACFRKKNHLNDPADATKATTAESCVDT